MGHSCGASHRTIGGSADAAKAVLNLKEKAHELTGQGVASLLPSATSRFARNLTAKMAEKPFPRSSAGSAGTRTSGLPAYLPVAVPRDQFRQWHNLLRRTEPAGVLK